MHASSPAALLAARLAHPAIWRGGDCAPEPASVPTGFATLDAVLPGGGWPGAGLAEMLVARDGIGEIALTLPALAALQRARRDVVWIAPPHRPYAPALAAAGIDLARFHVVRCARPDDALWACEQALRAPECGAAFAWLATRDERALRRLQVAARDGRTLGMLWRRPGDRGGATPVPLRLLLARHANAGPGRLAVHVLKRRGGMLGAPVLVDLDRSQESVDSWQSRRRFPWPRIERGEPSPAKALESGLPDGWRMQSPQPYRRRSASSPST